ncbi:MAG: glycosyltransferase family 2 protein, partial [Candidatus Altiarchaeota archaeon]|nr:glycosyltransferase family 2 protein [Candidatus Altiarchaeota archaeon]
GLRTIVNEGWGSFWWKYKQYRASKKLARNSGIKALELDLISGDLGVEVDLINKKVSVVIPTKNAGQDFEFTLKKIRDQKGLKETEIIVVDSGSTDETVKLAEDYGAEIYEIKPEDFNHGGTRNYGAGKAIGDYILFMVQDALPIGDYWMYNLVNVLEGDARIAAASCRQVPRSDADLFACFLIDNHNKSLGFYGDRITGLTGDFNKLPLIEKRKLCGLDDVSTLVRKDIFDEFKFKEIQYAEDIDLGLRLLKGGHNLAFLHSVGVMHSHNRNAFYILKRYYVDNKILQKLFNYRGYYPKCSLDELLYSILILYSALNLSVVSIKEFLQHTSDSNGYRDAIIMLGGLIQGNFKVSDVQCNGDRSLDEFFHKIDEITKERKINNKFMNILLSQYRNQLDNLKKFVVISNPNEEDFIDALYKLFSSVVASALSVKLLEYKDDRAYMVESLLGGGV